MKPTIFILILTLALNACQGSSGTSNEISENPQTVIQVAPENLVSLSFDVEGMTCTGCESSVEGSLKNMEGVVEAKASHETGKAMVEFDKTLVTAEAMEAGIVSRGYRVTGYTASAE